MTRATSWEETYELESGPQPLPWSDYESMLRKRFAELLASCPDEQSVQRFLEQHPCLVPGAWTPGVKSGHAPHPCALIIQPLLQGITTRSPDFMWISTHSSHWYPTLIEIESPGKRIFKRQQNTSPGAAFTQARDQLTQWATWFDIPANVEVFKRRYGVPDRMLDRTMELHLVLIYGRRAEFEGHAGRTRHRSRLLPSAYEELVSYDRLEPDQNNDTFLSVRSVAEGRYEAIAVPPTFRLGPWVAGELLLIDGIEEAIQRNEFMSADRKAFLVDRLSYWREWARRSDRGALGSAAWE